MRNILFSLCLISFCTAPEISFAETGGLPRHEIVFVLDASNSMNTSDPSLLALDAIEEILGVLPAGYSAGFVAFNDGVRIECPVGNLSDAAAAARQTVYSGYTDAGAGLAKALSLFSSGDGIEKTVVFFSDGEIMLPDPAATEASRQSFIAAKAAAEKRGIRMLTLAIGGRGRAASAGMYDGGGQKVFEAFSAEELAPLAQKLLYEEFGVQKLSVSTGEMQSGRLLVKIPLAQSAKLSRAKVIVVSNLPFANGVAAYSAAEGEMRIGRRHALVTLQRPQSGGVEVKFDAPAGAAVKADLVMEMQAAVKNEISFTAASESGGEQKAQIRLIPVDVANENLILLDDPYFEDRNVRVLVNGEERRAQVKKGAIVFSLPAQNTYDAEVTVRYEDLGVNMLAPETLQLRIARPESYALYVLAAFCCALAAVLVILYKRRKPVLPAPLPPASRYEYAGKLKVYLTESPDGQDVAPMVYNLYRRFTGEAISLDAMMESCGLPYKLPGADQLYFSPGAKKALVFTNNSECTVLKNRDLLVKDHSCLVYFDERIYITFEDERSEMILEYKNVKPSEK